MQYIHDHQLCETCRSIRIDLVDPTTYQLHNSINTFRNGTKLYVKKCCLFAYYTGSINNGIIPGYVKEQIYESDYTIQNGRLWIVKFTNNGIDSEEVFELQQKKETVFIWNNQEYKLRRNITLQEYPTNTYSIMNDDKYQEYLRSRRCPFTNSELNDFRSRFTDNPTGQSEFSAGPILTELQNTFTQRKFGVDNWLYCDDTQKSNLDGSWTSISTRLYKLYLS